MSDQTGLATYFNTYFKLLVEVHTFFPEMLDNNNKESIKLAAEKALVVKKVYNPTPWECFSYWVTLNSACYTTCQLESENDYYTCINLCTAFALAEYGICMGFAEL